MTKLRLNDVFKINGVPTHTFVPPIEYPRLLINLQTPGRGLVVEGPSGIGKTTAIEKAIASMDLAAKCSKLSARRQQDIDYINMLPELENAGIVIVDDFHKLPSDMQEKIADYVKYLADNEIAGTKIIVIGINSAGQSLVNFASDLVNRIDIIQFEQNPAEKIQAVIDLGSKSLNVKISTRDEIVSASSGSFYLAQMLCHETCLAADILEEQEALTNIAASFEKTRSDVWERLALRFREPCARFCRGNRFRRSGRAPYLHILRWLAESGDWILKIKEEERKNPKMRNSINEVITKHHLQNLIKDDSELPLMMHYDPDARWLIVEDPQFVFFIQNLSWRTFALQLGFTKQDIRRKYDFALSFAGTDRAIAEAVFNELTARSYEVFYDKNEQFRMIAQDLEAYLRPIYQSEAKYVICLLGKDYPKKIWTAFEQKHFRDRLPDGEVIPVLVGDVELDSFSELAKFGYERFSTKRDFELEVERIADILEQKFEADPDDDITAGEDDAEILRDAKE